MASIKPLGDRVVVEPKNESEEKIGSIIVPDTAKEKPQKGKVIAVGQGKMTDEGKRIPMDIKKDDVVLVDYTTPKLRVIKILREDIGKNTWRKYKEQFQKRKTEAVVAQSRLQGMQHESYVG